MKILRLSSVEGLFYFQTSQTFIANKLAMLY